MKIVYFGNNWLGWKVLEWLQAQGEEIAGLVLHPHGRCKFGDELLHTVALPPERVFDASRLRCPDVIEQIQDLRPDIGISILFGYILRAEILDLFPGGVINLHPSLLPFNRGACPNVWSIIDGTPAGVTLHYVDAHIDTGDMIAQQPVELEAVDTGGSLYLKLERAAFDLFCQTWPQIRAGEVRRSSQSGEKGTFHLLRELESISEIDLDGTYTGRDLINILRARTFPPYPGAFFRCADGRRVHMHLELEYGE